MSNTNYFTDDQGASVAQSMLAWDKARYADRVDDRGENVVRLMGADFGFLSPEDLALAEESVDMMPGRWAVEMCPVDQETVTPSGLIRVATDAWTERADAGIVISTPDDLRVKDERTGERLIVRFPLSVGQAVVVDHTAGQRIDGAVFGDYHATSEVRLMGSIVMSKGYAAPWPVSKSILMYEHQDGLLVVGEKPMMPYADWVLIARDGVIEKSEGGIFLPDSAKHGCAKGTVIQAGPRAWGPDSWEGDDGKLYAIPLEARQRVQFLANVTKGREARDVFADVPETQRLCLVRADAILAVLPTEDVPDDYFERLVAVTKSVAV